MTKKEFVEQLLEKTGLEVTKKDMEEIFNKTFELLTEQTVKDGKFTVSGFGTFRLRQRNARKARNPKTGETIKVKASKSIAFKASNTLKDKLS